ncbi:MAG: pyridoxal phosphate-dependent aminotransferase [Gammaproteobacteria bacterium]
MKQIYSHKIIDLSRNENSLGANPFVLHKIKAMQHDLNRYPAIDGMELKECLAEYHGINSEQIVLGNGSIMLLDMAIRAFLKPNQVAIVPKCSFSGITEILTQAGAAIVYADMYHWQVDLQAILIATTAHTALIIIVNPNNPTGTVLSKDQIIDFLNKIPENITVIIDEAYIDYLDQKAKYEAVELVNRYANLIITRTFSKAYGLAALRIGYSVSAPQLAKRINKFRQPFTNNSIALAAATLSVQERYYLTQVRKFNHTCLQHLSSGFEFLQLDYIPSFTNFIAVDFGNQAMDIFNKLKDSGILVAPLQHANMSNHLRISVSGLEENQRLLNTLMQFNLNKSIGCKEVYEA